MRTIQYGVDAMGLVVSRVNSEIAYPILDYEGMTPANNFRTSYNLERMPVIELAGIAWNSIKWTRKIPTEIKNTHRRFWGLPPLS